MKKRFLPGLMLVASIQAFADQTPEQELATSTGLPFSEIQEMLAKCDSVDETTQDMYFCAWRGLVAAEQELRRIVDQRNSQRPKHKTALNARIAHWKKARDADCKKLAHKEYAGGSIEPVEARSCQAGTTQEMVKAMRKDPTAIPCKNNLKVCHHDPISQ